MTQEILKIIIEAVGSVIGILITFVMTKYVMPWVKMQMNSELVCKAVKAAEKIYQESGMGQKKKEYVRDFLAKMGCFTPFADGSIPEPWNTLIEAAVKDLDIVEDQAKKAIEG